MEQLGVRARKQGDIGQMKVNEFIEKVCDEIKNFVND